MALRPKRKNERRIPTVGRVLRKTSDENLPEKASKEKEEDYMRLINHTNIEHGNKIWSRRTIYGSI